MTTAQHTSSQHSVSAANLAPLREFTATAVRALVLYSLAEFQSGHATTIRVTADGSSFSVADDGRGHSIDKSVEGSSYLKFVYTHFDYPFEPGCGAPIQLQGIGMSLVNALCSELTVTVKKRDATLRIWFRDGALTGSHRTDVDSEETGTTVSATLKPQLQGNGETAVRLEAWLLDVLLSCPSLKLIFNGRQLQSRQQSDA
jgi:DNA gyrase/topoisomerase IV subunit B